MTELEVEARRRIAAWSDRVLIWTYLWCCAHDHERAATWMRNEIERREAQPENPPTSAGSGEMLFVLAGNYRQFEEWMRAQGLNRFQAVYAHNVENLYGYRPDKCRYVRIGTYLNNPYYSEIMSYLQMRGIREKAQPA